MNILFILVLEVNFTNKCLVWLWGHLSLLCCQIYSWTLLKPPLYTVLWSFLVSGADSWTMWFTFGNMVSVSLDVFHKHLNSFDKNVKFTVELGENDKLPFLEILLIKSDFHLLFSVYRKPTHIRAI